MKHHAIVNGATLLLIIALGIALIAVGIALIEAAKVARSNRRRRQ